MIDFSVYGKLIDDALLPNADSADVEAVCEAIRDYCGWHIAPVMTDDVVTVDQLGNRVIRVPSLRVTEVSSVKSADGREIEGFSWSEDGLLRLESGWPRGYRAVKVTMTHGFAAVPPTILSVARDMLLDRASAAAGGEVKRVELDDAQIEYPTVSSEYSGVRRDLGRAYGHLLDRYRL